MTKRLDQLKVTTQQTATWMHTPKDTQEQHHTDL